MPEHLHVAGVGRVAVAHLGGYQRAPHALGKRRVLDVREPGAQLLVWQEQVPQPLALGELLELLDRRQHDPRIFAREQLAHVWLLARRDLALLKGDQALQQLLRTGGVREVHRRERTVTGEPPTEEMQWMPSTTSFV